MRIRIHHIIIGYALLLAPPAQASGSATSDSVAPTGKIIVYCMGVNGSGRGGQSPAPQERGCDTSTRDKSTLRGTGS